MNPAGMTTNHPQHSTDRQETTTDNACTLESAALIAYDERPSDITSLLNLLQKIFRAGMSCMQREHTDRASFRQTAQASLHARSHRRPSTIRDLRSYINRILNYAEWADVNIRDITRKQCKDLLYNHFRFSGHVFNKAKAILHSIFTYAQQQNWCESNPVYGFENLPITERTITPLTIKQIQSLLKASASHNDLHCMQAPIRLMLWCGIRPEEVRRLHWSDIDRRENVVYVDSRASKTGGARAVPLRGGALELKKFNSNSEELIAPANWIKLWRKLRIKAGLYPWQQDVLRHTFASMHLKYFHNPGLLQEEMGHRDYTLLRTRYLNMRNISAYSARVFFSADQWEQNVCRERRLTSSAAHVK